MWIISSIPFFFNTIFLFTSFTIFYPYSYICGKLSESTSSSQLPLTCQLESCSVNIIYKKSWKHFPKFLLEKKFVYITFMSWLLLTFVIMSKICFQKSKIYIVYINIYLNSPLVIFKYTLLLMFSINTEDFHSIVVFWLQGHYLFSLIIILIRIRFSITKKWICNLSLFLKM